MVRTVNFIKIKFFKDLNTNFCVCVCVCFTFLKFSWRNFEIIYGSTGFMMAVWRDLIRFLKQMFKNVIQCFCKTPGT